jgi:glycosyltransferase involved in cell wall biosynthesis
VNVIILDIEALFKKIYGRFIRVFVLLGSLFGNVINSGNCGLYYIVEDAEWSILHDGKMIVSNLKYIKGRITKSHYGIRNSIVHFGSVNCYYRSTGYNIPHKSNKVVVTWFHVSPNDGRVSKIYEADKYVDIWHTSSNITKTKLISFGIQPDKIVIIPLGIDTKKYKSVRLDKKVKLKSVYKIPQNRFVIGSFQKDGNGWDEGLDPKLIKGPDIFCDVIDALHKNMDIFVILSGPARGYVKSRLDAIGVSYYHKYYESPDDIALLYNMIDLYLVTSRVEGGPKALLESMASGVPLISTKVGMAPELITDGENGFLVDINDVDQIVNYAIRLNRESGLKDSIIRKGLTTSQKYDWLQIANNYYSQLYRD